MFTFVAVATSLLLTVNVAEVAPAAIVTEAGTVAAAVLLLVSAMRAPPAGAAEPSLTVPVLLAPPATVIGFNVTELRAEFTVSVAIREAPRYVAVMLTPA
jgi:hypothetical protein